MMPLTLKPVLSNLKGWCPFKFEKNISGKTAIKELLIGTTFDPP
jgi:hypothetical protein